MVRGEIATGAGLRRRMPACRVSSDASRETLYVATRRIAGPPPRGGLDPPTAATSMDPRICLAIAERQLLMFAYGGAVRVVEPHLHGRTTAGHDALSAWMRSGWSRADPEGGWRMYRTDALEGLQILPERFPGPRPGFNPRDPHFVEVYCRVGAPGSETAAAAPD